MKALRLPISILFQYQDLLLQLTRRSIDSKNRGSWLGSLWNVIQPLLLLTVYTFVFSTIFEGRFGVIEEETAVEYALGIFLGIALLGLFNGSIASAADCITANRNYVKKVVFPLEIIPVTVVLSNAYTFVVSLALIFAGMLIFQVPFTVQAIWLPLILIPNIIFALGIAWILAAIGVFYRDVSQLITVITTCMLWVSAVFYSAREIPAAAWIFARFNPVMLCIEMSRDVLLWQMNPNSKWLIYCYICSFLTYFIGFWLFRSLRSLFADVV